MTPLCWESANPNLPSSECSGDVPKLIGTVRSAPKRVAVYEVSSIVMCHGNTKTEWPHKTRPFEIRGCHFSTPKGPVPDLPDPIDKIYCV